MKFGFWKRGCKTSLLWMITVLSSLVLSISIQLVIQSSASAKTESDFDKAVGLYNQKHYLDALSLFKRVCESNASDSRSNYYYALCLHQLGKLKEAKAQYRSVASKFAGTVAGELAVKAAAALDSGNSKDAGSSFNIGQFALPTLKEQTDTPVEARIYFTRENDSIIVNATVNNRPVKMIFDTGSEVCTFGKNHLQELGLPQPTGAPSEKSTGLGGRQNIASWQMEADISLGTLRKQHCAISILENLEGEPLLGQNFFKDFNYTIENTANCIRFKQKSSAASQKTGTTKKEWNVVPFQKFGDQIVVNAEVNGKPCPMVFDTGAQRTSFTYAQLKQLKIEVPPDAELETRVGASGRITAFAFPIERIKLGPIEKKYIKISAVSADLQYPLLGQNFYNDYEYTVDTAARCIRFNRR